MTGATLQVLCIGDDDLRAELAAALVGASPRRAEVRSAPDFAGAEAQVRALRPRLVCVELGRDPSALRAFATHLRSLAPDCVLLGARSAAAGDDEGALLVEALRLRFEDILPRPLSSAELRPVLERLAASGSGHAVAGNVVAFHSTKGGVGKSTLSLSTACVLARRHPERVLLVDASLQLGVCASALDLAPPTDLSDAARECERLDDTLLRQLCARHACGLRLLAAPSGPVAAADVDEQAIARVLATARRAFDYVVVDTLPIVDAAMLAALDLADRIYLVNQGTVPDVIGAARLVEVLDSIGIDAAKRRIVLNRNLPDFPGALATSSIEQRLGRTVDHEIPYERRLYTALNLGEPHALRASSGSPWARAIDELAREIDGSEAEPRGSVQRVWERFTARFRAAEVGT